MPKINYIERAKIARKAGLFTGQKINLTRADKSKITRIFKAVPALENTKYNNYRSVKVPKIEREEFAKRGFKVVGDRVLINDLDATRVSYSNKYKVITAYADHTDFIKRNRYSLDLDIESFMSQADANDNYTRLAAGGSGSIDKVIDREEINNYLSDFYERTRADPDTYKVPVLTESIRKLRNDFNENPPRYKVPKNWQL